MMKKMKTWLIQSLGKYHRYVNISLAIIGISISIWHYPPSKWVPYDGALYIDIAHSLTYKLTSFSYQGIYMMFRPPIYPYTLSIFYRVLPDNFYVVIARITSSLFYAGTAVLIFSLFRGYLGNLKALGASLFYIVNPIAMGMSIQPLVHSEFTFFYLFSIYWLLKWTEETKKKYIILFGLFTGITILTRYTGLIIIPVSITYIYILLFSNKLDLNLAEIVKHYIIGASITILTILPWMILGHTYYSGAINPFIVASREVNAATRVPASEYIKEVVNVLGAPVIILIVLGLLYSMVQRDNFHALLLSWGLLGLTSILTIIHKEIRFITFLTPLLAILSVEGSHVLLKTLDSLCTKTSMKHEFIKFSGFLIILLFFYGSCYSHSLEYINKYYYAGATQAKVFEDFKRLTRDNEKSMKLLVSPNLYPYGGLFLSNAEIYQMSSYKLNWLVYGIKEQPPNVSRMIINGDFDYVIYCETPHSRVWIVRLKHSQEYVSVSEIFNGKCKILKHR